MNVEFLTRAPFCRCSLRHDLAHNTRYVLMFASGCLFWWPRAGADHLPRRLSCRGRMTLVFAGLPFELFVAIALMSYGKPVRSSGMMFLSVFVLITLAAALVRHRQRGTAADRQAARRITPKSNRECRRQPRGAASQPAPAGVHTRC